MLDVSTHQNSLKSTWMAVVYFCIIIQYLYTYSICITTQYCDHSKISQCSIPVLCILMKLRNYVLPMQPKIHKNWKRITTLWAVTLSGYFFEVSVLQRSLQTWASLLQSENAIKACGLFCSTRLLVLIYECCLLLRFESYLFNSIEMLYM